MRRLINGLIVACMLALPLEVLAGEVKVYFLGGSSPHIQDNIDVNGWKKFDVKYECWDSSDCSWLIELFKGTSQVSKSEGYYKGGDHKRKPQTVSFYAWGTDAFHLKLTAKTTKMRFAIENVVE